MKFEIRTIEHFEKELKRLLKKYPSLKEEVQLLGELLEENPLIGTSLGKECYKIRISIKSKGKGKSGGGRIITCVKITAETVTLISIYDKSEQEDISGNLLLALLKENNLL